MPSIPEIPFEVGDSASPLAIETILETLPQSGKRDPAGSLQRVDGSSACQSQGEMNDLLLILFYEKTKNKSWKKAKNRLEESFGRGFVRLAI
ncbi:hypothetical protein [Synechococcus sp. OH20]|uniref:hypothetical protein n=1 Tax=Synechococcus sp. OH20 TaxID=139337 RepID=UPI0039C64A59